MKSISKQLWTMKSVCNFPGPHVSKSGCWKRHQRGILELKFCDGWITQHCQKLYQIQRFWLQVYLQFKPERGWTFVMIKCLLTYPWWKSQIAKKILISLSAIPRAIHICYCQTLVNWSNQLEEKIYFLEHYMLLDALYILFHILAFSEIFLSLLLGSKNWSHLI